MVGFKGIRQAKNHPPLQGRFLGEIRLLTRISDHVPRSSGATTAKRLYISRLTWAALAAAQMQQQYATLISVPVQSVWFSIEQHATRTLLTTAVHSAVVYKFARERRRMPCALEMAPQALRSIDRRGRSPWSRTKSWL